MRIELQTDGYWWLYKLNYREMMKAGILEEMVEDTMEGLEGEEEEDAAQVENPKYQILVKREKSWTKL